jgi:recombination protein RecR
MFSPSLERLIQAFGQLPGVGPKTAQRYAFYLLQQPAQTSYQLAEALHIAKESLKHCSVCYHWSDSDPCPICTNTHRNPYQLCVVAGPQDVFALERAHSYQGKYHVLGGLVSPLEGVGPDDLTTRALLERLTALQNALESNAEEASQTAIEVVLALPPSTEGDTTSLYLSRLLKPLGVTVTRIAFGLPVGGELDYADQLTLARALAGRTAL